MNGEKPEELEELLSMTGALMIGPSSQLAKEEGVIGGTMKSILEFGLSHQILTPQEIMAHYPGLNVSSDEIGVFESDGAVLVPELCISAYLREAKQHGACLTPCQL